MKKIKFSVGQVVEFKVKKRKKMSFYKWLKKHNNEHKNKKRIT